MTTSNLIPAASTSSIFACERPALPDRGYLLLDPSALSDAHTLASQPLKVCVPANWGQDAMGLPVLIDLAQCDVLQHEKLALQLENEDRSCQQTPLMHVGICAHIEINMGIDAFAAHLAERLLVMPISRDGNRALKGVLWRYFDPRVFANLCWMLDSGSLATLTGSASRWTFPWLGAWYKFDAAADDGVAIESQPLAAQADRIAGFMPVDMEMWARAQQVSTINQVLVRLAMLEPLWVQRVAVARRVETAMTEARHCLHWDHPEDQAQYAEYVVRYGPAFLEHPKLIEYWPQIKSRTTNLRCADLVSLLSPDDYTALAQAATAPVGKSPSNKPFTRGANR